MQSGREVEFLGVIRSRVGIGAYLQFMQPYYCVMDSWHIKPVERYLSVDREWPNNSPEPTPIGAVSPHSRLTDVAARLSFCR